MDRSWESIEWWDVYEALLGPATIYDVTLVRTAGTADLAFELFPGAGRFRFSTPASAAVRLELFDVHGRPVRRLLDRELLSGSHVVAWNGEGEDGTRLEAGLYWARLTAESSTLVRRVTVLN